MGIYYVFGIFRNKQGEKRMKKRTFLTGILGITLVFALILAACENPSTPSPTQYTVTFNPDGGSVDPITLKVDSGGTVSVLPVPAKAGNTFGGWWTAANGGGERFTTSTQVTRDITLYAKWTADSQNPPVTNNPLEGTWFYTINDMPSEFVTLFTSDTWYYVFGQTYLNSSLTIGADNSIQTGDQTLDFEVQNNMLSVSFNGDNPVTYNKKLTGTGTAANPALGLWIVDTLGQEKKALIISKVVSGRVTVIIGNYDRINYTLKAGSNATTGTIVGNGEETEYQITAAGKLRIAYGGNAVPQEFTPNAALFPTFF